MKKVKTVAALLLTLAVLPVVAQETRGLIREMRFENQPITDILLALGEVSGTSMVPDDTVSGQASYYFAETDFETALQLFLQTYKLYYRREGDVFYVSRIQTRWDEAAGVISMDAEDVELPQLVRAASRAMGRTVLFDPLPSDRLTVHVQSVTPQKLLEILTRRHADYRIETDADYFYLKREVRKPEGGPQQAAVAPTVERIGDLYSVDVASARFSDLLDGLFRAAKLEYSSFMGRDSVLENLRFTDRGFAEMLRLLLERAGGDYATVGEVYYIFEIQQRDILKKLKTTVQVPLTYIGVRDLPNLFPSELLTSKLYKLDVPRNAVILNGSVEEIAPVQEFIRNIDRPSSGQEYYLFTLNYLEPKDIKSVLPPEFTQIEPIVVPGSRAFVVPLPAARRETFAAYIKLIDRPGQASAVRLRYINAEQLLETLPPSVPKEDVIATGDPSLVFVKGTPERVAAFRRELAMLDIPVPQIRYQFLVIQYQRGESLNWGDPDAARFKVEPASAADGKFLGTIGQLLSLNFDTVDTLGYQLAVKLSLDLSNNDAHVMADTALTGLSGQEVQFQNTNTYRYREPEVDEKGNTTYTGVSREITAGLIFNVQGWVSGEGMITMDVGATISKQGTDTTGTAGILPPTSENVVTTQVRTASGEPVVIGGLIRRETTKTTSKVPVLGDIPLLGFLFRSAKDSIDNTELVIYIVPHVEIPAADEESLNDRLDRLYRRYVKGSL